MEVIAADPLRFLAGIVAFSLLIIITYAVFLSFILAILILLFEKITGIRPDWDSHQKLYKSVALVLMVIFSSYLSYAYLKKAAIVKRERAQERQEVEQKRQECLANQDCQDSIALRKSKTSNGPVVSSTGNYFFDGALCKNQCEEVFSGYQWAKDRGITKELGCENLRLERLEGCLVYVEEIAIDDDWHDEQTLTR